MSSKMTLYTLADAARNAIDGLLTIDEDTGEIIGSPDQLDELGLALADKAEAVLMVSREYGAMAGAAMAESKRLAALAKGYEAKERSLRRYLAGCVERAGAPIECPSGRVSVRRTEAVQVLDESAIPARYMAPQPPKPAKMLIKRALKSGEDVPGAALVVNENLQIK